MLLSRAAVIWQSDGFAKLQRLCHTLFFAIFFFRTPLFCQLSCVIFRLYFMFFSFFFGGFN